jgi:hypothetical protein|tara:strand:- start:27 stop:308 length:282 start_codon:yes stop_codon:yes gene_type:complete
MAGQEEKGRLWLYDNSYKTSDKHPGKTGPGEIPRAFLKALVEKAKADGGDVVKVQCASWERVSKQGNPYTFITIEPDEKPKKREPVVEDDLPF